MAHGKNVSQGKGSSGSPFRVASPPESFVESILLKFPGSLCEGLIITSPDRLVLHAENLIRIYEYL